MKVGEKSRRAESANFILKEGKNSWIIVKIKQRKE
jgi:hypothetical protein